MNWFEILKHYSKEEVQEEIFEYSKNRWIALEGKKNLQRVFIRHIHNKPLEFKDKSDIKRFLVIFQKFHPRTIYATVNVYREVKEEKLKDPENIILSSPIIDIDGTLEDLDLILEASRILTEEIMNYGIERGVFLKWSGRGVHIHINEKSFSEEIRKKYHPLDIAYAVVDYILFKRKEDIQKIIERARGTERPFKIENKIDIQRVFTVPLSFHRELDFVAICFKPDEIERFSLDWVDPKKYRHNKKWREYEEGEGDKLAEIAIRERGSYLKKYYTEEMKRGLRVSVERKRYPGKIGRFQVMALLQAARYYLLKGNLEKAKSFGLNRAIFYAWAKYYKPKYGMSKRRFLMEKLGMKEEDLPKENVGDEVAFLSKRGWFMIGDKEQLPEDFDRQVKEKIEKVIPFEEAWKAALEYLKKFPKEILLDQQEFFERVYKPVRDNFERIVEEYKKRRGNFK